MVFLVGDDNSHASSMKDEHWVRTIRLYQERIAQLECQLTAIHKSYSWRLTWPIRKLNEFILKSLRNLRGRACQTFMELFSTPRRFVQNAKIDFRDLWLVLLRKILTFGFSMGSALPIRHHLAKYPALQAALNRLARKIEKAADRPRDFIFPESPSGHILVSEEFEILSRKYGLLQGVHHDLRSPLEAHFAFYRNADL